MTDVSKLAEEREQIFKDLFSGNVPTRVPISIPLDLGAAIEYSGKDIAEIHWNSERIYEVFKKIAEDFVMDTAPGAGRRYPSFYQILGSKPYVMSSSGHMQHPNVMGMEPEDYDEFIDSPLDCIMDKILPRLYTELDASPNQRARVLAKAIQAYMDEFSNMGKTGKKLREKFGFPSIPGNLTTAPFDFMADFFRSFTGIMVDIKRYPDKVVAACEAMLPLAIKNGKLREITNFGSTIIPLHMGPFMSTEEFEKFYWPTLKKQVEALSDLGINVQLFVESDYMRYLDYLYELPENTILRFEYGDPKVIKEKLGDKHIISGLYPLNLLHAGTKQQCLDKAKELLDILAPGGGYWFNADKSAFDMHGNIEENLRAVLEYIHENGRYSEAERANNNGQLRSTDKAEQILKEVNKQIDSKYYSPWEEYYAHHQELEDQPVDVIAPKLQKYEETWFNFIMNLCS